MFWYQPISSSIDPFITNFIEEAQLETPPEATAEIALNIAMAIVSEVGQRAIELHEQAVTAVQSYRDSVKEALEGFEKDGGSKEDWEILSKLSETKTQAIDEAEQIGATLTELVEKLQTNITEAKEKGLTTSAEIASETVAKMTYALQQVKTRLSESQVEGNVLKKFQEFIKEGKENLAKELAAIRPGFEIDTVSQLYVIIRQYKCEFCMKTLNLFSSVIVPHPSPSVGWKVRHKENKTERLMEGRKYQF